MSKIKDKDTTPELIVRKIAHRQGFRYRLHRKDLPGKPDLVFPRFKKAIFVHGCFWHQHENCRRAHLPRSNRTYWLEKLEKNKHRDIRAQRELESMGWQTLVIWECETGKPALVAERLMHFLVET